MYYYEENCVVSLLLSGSECMLEFMKMQSCFSKYPKLYGHQIDVSNETEEKLANGENEEKRQSNE